MSSLETGLYLTLEFQETTPQVVLSSLFRTSYNDKWKLSVTVSDQQIK